MRRRRRKRTLGAGLALAGCLLVAACGGAWPAAKPASGSRSGLGAARFRLLDALYAAAAEPAEEEPSPAAVASADRRLVAACKALDAGDSLLGPLRRACLSRATQAGAGAPKCPPPRLPKDTANENTFTGDTCPAYVRSLLAEETTGLRLGAEVDRTIAAAGLSPACRAALRTPPVADEIAEDEASAFTLLLRGQASGSAAADAAAGRRFEDAELLGPQLPSGAQQLARFRGACG